MTHGRDGSVFDAAQGSWRLAAPLFSGVAVSWPACLMRGRGVRRKGEPPMREHLVEHPAACEATPALINHIVERYHRTHRREMPELVALARKVETVHGTDPNAPHGLADALQGMIGEMEVHMKKEELLLFPALSRGRTQGAAERIATMRHDHDGQEESLARVAAITHGFRLPADACASWQRLYAGTRKLVEDLEEHIYLENEILFPRFEGDPEAGQDARGEEAPTERPV